MNVTEIIQLIGGLFIFILIASAAYKMTKNNYDMAHKD